LASQFRLCGEADQQVEALALRFGLKAVALTLGAAGSRLWRDGEWRSEPGRDVSVVDAVGAGDSYTAAMVLGLLQGWSTAGILRRATDIAAFVCTQAGATPELLSDLREPFLS
jgi:fructokinase